MKDDGCELRDYFDEAPPSLAERDKSIQALLPREVIVLTENVRVRAEKGWYPSSRSRVAPLWERLRVKKRRHRMRGGACRAGGLQQSEHEYGRWTALRLRCGCTVRRGRRWRVQLNACLHRPASDQDESGTTLGRDDCRLARSRRERGTRGHIATGNCVRPDRKAVVCARDVVREEGHRQQPTFARTMPFERCDRC